jgi:hypothetical protein
MFKLVCLFVIVAAVAAEPPRFRQRAFRTFARQENADQPASEGYAYNAPPGERLRLPIKSGLFARQEAEPASSSGGYSYPKPTDSYGPPEEADQTESPEATTANPDVDDQSTESDDSGESATENPQAETLRSLQATQFRRANAKFSRIQKQQQKLRAKLVQPTSPVQQVVYVDYEYPIAEYVEPQYVYVFK